MTFCLFPRFKAWCRRVWRAASCSGEVPPSLDSIIKELMSTAQDLKDQVARTADLAAKTVTLVNTLDAEIAQLQAGQVLSQEDLDASVAALSTANDSLAALQPPQ